MKKLSVWTHFHVLLAAGLLASCRVPSEGTDSKDAGVEDAAHEVISEDAGTVEETSDAGSQETDAGETTLDAGIVNRCAGKVGVKGDTERPFESGGRQRKVYWHVPSTYDGTKEVPLVLVFHGYTDNAKDIRRMSRFDEVSDKENFIVAYPDGLNMSWNAGVCCGLSRLTQVDDVTFVKDTLALLENEYCLDSKRIFAAGFSNGGFLSHRLACEMSDRFAAIGVGSGQMGGYACNPSRAVPVVEAHGTADPIVFLIGNPVLGYPSTEEVMKSWAKRNGCDEVPLVSKWSDKVEFKNWPNCREGAEVQLYLVSGGTHEWFGNRTWDDAQAFKNTPTFWEFFKRHPMK